MAFIYSEHLGQKLRRLRWTLPDGPTGEFARAAGIASFAVVALALVLPGAEPGAALLSFAAFCAASIGAGWLLHRGYPHDRLGLCNYVTLARLVLVCALMAPPLAGGQLSWAYVALATVTLSLDGVDGWIARRQRLVSAFGARFDVEVDSVLALVLAINAALGSALGPAILLLGLPRYAFGVAGLWLPWMRPALPERFSRKVVCVVQIVTLIVLQVPVLPPVAAGFLVFVAAVALAWSFARDVAWLWRERA